MINCRRDTTVERSNRQRAFRGVDAKGPDRVAGSVEKKGALMESTEDETNQWMKTILQKKDINRLILSKPPS